MAVLHLWVRKRRDDSPSHPPVRCLAGAQRRQPALLALSFAFAPTRVEQRPTPQRAKIIRQIEKTSTAMHGEHRPTLRKFLTPAHRCLNVETSTLRGHFA
jgi:hypothetical protein